MSGHLDVYIDAEAINFRATFKCQLGCYGFPVNQVHVGITHDRTNTEAGKGVAVMFLG